jgi:hypothetical protein
MDGGAKLRCNRKIIVLQSPMHVTAVWYAYGTTPALYQVHVFFSIASLVIFHAFTIHFLVIFP